MEPFSLDSITGFVLKNLMQLLRITLTLTRPFADKILDIVYAIFMGFSKPLPPIDDKILLYSATELAEKIRKKQLKSKEVVEAYIRRIKQVNPIINAVVDQRFEEAIKEAVAVDAVLASGAKSEQRIAEDTPLLGVPFTSKEGQGVKGLAQTKGLVREKNRKSPWDSDAVAQYRAAGAIPVIVSNVPELNMWWESANHVFGMTKNPFDKKRTVGGSSGGEGAIITSAGAVIGIGTDLGGSIRIPSCFCGIYGHKPTQGLVSNRTSWPKADENPIDQFISTGPMCRYAQDLPLLVRLLAGNNANKIRLNEKVDFHRMKIFYMEEFPGCLLSATSDIKASVRKAAKHFEKEFSVIATKVKLEELKYCLFIWQCKMLEAGAPPFKTVVAGEDETVNATCELFKNLLGYSDHTLPVIFYLALQKNRKDASYHKGLKLYDDLTQKLEEMLFGDAILLLPTHPEPPPHYLMTLPKFPNISYTCIFNVLGFPSTHIPTGLSNGLPIGIQAVSTKFKDHLTLAAALELDKVFKGWRSPCPVIA